MLRLDSNPKDYESGSRNKHRLLQEVLLCASSFRQNWRRWIDGVARLRVYVRHRESNVTLRKITVRIPPVAHECDNKGKIRRCWVENRRTTLRQSSIVGAGKSSPHLFARSKEQSSRVVNPTQFSQEWLRMLEHPGNESRTASDGIPGGRDDEHFHQETW